MPPANSPPTPSASEGSERGRRAGRRAGLALYSVLLVSFIVVCSVQILIQVWAPPETPAAAPCREAVLALVSAVDRAREAASRETGGEREAMARFRAALEPEWALRSGLPDHCKGDPEALSALRDVDRYRYAEEHAVRYAASNLSSLRQRMDALKESLVLSSGAAR